MLSQDRRRHRLRALPADERGRGGGDGQPAAPGVQTAPRQGAPPAAGRGAARRAADGRPLQGAGRAQPRHLGQHAGRRLPRHRRRAGRLRGLPASRRAHGERVPDDPVDRGGRHRAGGDAGGRCGGRPHAVRALRVGLRHRRRVRHRRLPGGQRVRADGGGQLRLPAAARGRLARPRALRRRRPLTASTRVPPGRAADCLSKRCSTSSATPSFTHRYLYLQIKLPF